MSSVAAISPVIDVVTGTDWASVIASIATGVAAIVGIGGTAYLAKRASADAKRSLLMASDDAKANRNAASSDLQASIKASAEQLVTSINAEDRRTLRAEKQRVYSEFQGSIDDAFVAAVHLHDRTTGAADLSNALTAMYRATAAVKLIAPEPLGELANTTAQAVADETGTARVGTEAFDRENRIYDDRQRLYRLMREDLGVSMPQEAELVAAGSEPAGTPLSAGVTAGDSLPPG